MGWIHPGRKRNGSPDLHGGQQNRPNKRKVHNFKLTLNHKKHKIYRVISKEQGKKKAEEMFVEFIEASAKDGTGI